MTTRISIDNLWMLTAGAVALRGTCIRAQVGAVIVQSRRVVSTGYVGSPPGAPHCKDVGCVLGPDGGCISTIHAEMNAITFAARNGARLEGAGLYSTVAPCLACSKAILGAGIREVVFLADYRDQGGVSLLQEHGVAVRQAVLGSHTHPFMGYDTCLLCGRLYSLHG